MKRERLFMKIEHAETNSNPPINETNVLHVSELFLYFSLIEELLK